MRPGQNKRMRGRNNNNNNRKGPNPLTRSYESNGPDVKIRGTAHHVGEKYLQLARDAHSSGDPVRAESYLQHAEHYFRVIAAAQQAQQAQHGYGRPSGDADYDDDDDGDDGSMPDRFASPSERPVQPSFGDRPPFQHGQNQGQGQTHGGDRSASFGQGERNQGDRGQGERSQGDRNQGDRGYDNRNGRNYDNRGYQDRHQQDRGYQGNGQTAAAGNGGHSGQGGAGSNGYERNASGRGEAQDRGAQFVPAQERPQQQDRSMRDQPRDFDNRPRGPRPMADLRQPPVDEAVNGGLPAFITAPSRVQAEQHGSAPAESAEPARTEDEGVHMRPRRRRRSKADYGDKGELGGAGEPSPMATSSEPVAD